MSWNTLGRSVPGPGRQGLGIPAPCPSGRPGIENERLPGSRCAPRSAHDQLAPPVRLALTDLLTGSPYAVELEKDLSAKRQILGVVIQREGSGDWA